MAQVNKDFLSGQPIIGQLLSFIPSEIFKQAEQATNSDKHCKKMNSKIHFITLFYATLTKNSSLREVCKSIVLVASRLIQFGFTHIPCRSTLSDANGSRTSDYFAQMYRLLYQHYKPYLSEIHFSFPIGGEVRAMDVEVFDSTTITLFKEILKGAGRKSINGKNKGGIKAFTKMNLAEGVPNFVSYDAASTNECSFLKLLRLEKGSIGVFDKGSVKYGFFQKLTGAGINFVTRKKDNMKYEVVEKHEADGSLGILSDEKVRVGYKENQISRTVDMRLIKFKDPISGEIIEFTTNIEGFSAFTITQLYKNRWVIEVLFKQLKQNFELRYFLSDSANGIKSQIWMALILNLLFTVMHKVTKEAEDFSTLVAVAAKNLCSNVNLIKYITDGTAYCKSWMKVEIQKMQLSMFVEKDEGVFVKT